MSIETLSTVANPLLSEREIENQTDAKIKAVSLRNWRSQGKYRKELPFVKVIEAFLAGEVSA